ncbi:MAG: hypothetical protein WBG08_11755, partial [Litorimonas sp.]
AQPGRPAQPATPAVYGTCHKDGVPYRCVKTPARSAQPATPARPADPGGAPTESCRNVRGPDRNVCTPRAPKHHKWHGCVGSRRNASNKDVDYTNGEDKVPGFLNLQCAEELLPLTTDFAKVRRKVNGLSTRGETYTASGLMWGYRLLTDEAPFPLPATSSGTAPRRILIFMTDGTNTRSRSGQKHDGTDRTKADKLSKDICAMMHKERDMEVYSVSFKVTDSKAIDLIRDCASEDDMYYQAADAAKLKTAFEDIAFDLLTPRLTQ